MSELLSATELDRIADVISSGPYEGYPSNDNRLFLGSVGLHLSEAALFVPDGPWHVTGHPNRQGKNPAMLDPEVPSPGHPRIEPQLSERWTEAGLMLDQYGRPIHPNWRQLLADDRIGLPTGTGFFYKYGPNATVDPAVHRERNADEPSELLLIQRKIGGLWALPGGFMDREDESAAAGARREAGEETHLYDIGGTDEVIFHKLPVGLRDTLHAWTENTVVLIDGDQDYLFDTEPTPGDDAIDVGWFTQEQVAELRTFDAHKVYIDLVFDRLNNR